MKLSDPQSGRVPWIALAALAVLALGIGAAFRQWRIVPPAGPGVPAPAGEPTEQVIGQALEQTTPAAGPPPPVDSTALKRRWLDEVRGIDVSGLDSLRRELFLRFANAQRCTCGCGYTLAGCRASDMTCDVSGAQLDALLDSVRAGRIGSARGIRARPHGRLTGVSAGAKLDSLP